MGKVILFTIRCFQTINSIIELVYKYKPHDLTYKCLMKNQFCQMQTCTETLVYRVHYFDKHVGLVLFVAK